MAHESIGSNPHMSNRAVSLQRAGIHLAMGLSLRMRVGVCLRGLDEFGQKVKGNPT
jgi:hypothetical protein